MEKSRLPYGRSRSGRSDLGGEHTGGPEHEGMTAASKSAPYGSRCTVHGGAPTRSERGEGRCREGRNGHVHLTSRRGRGPSTQGQIRRENVGGAAGKAANLVGWKSPCRQLPDSGG
jgi:hypothetical protein